MPIDISPPCPVAEKPVVPVEIAAFQSTLNFIAGWEKFIDHVYPDQGGRPTIGYGFLLTPRDPLWAVYMDAHGKRKQGMFMTKSAALKILNAKLAVYEAEVRKMLTRAPTENQFTALVSLAYNIGLHEFRGSTVLEMFNANRLEECPKWFKVWDKVDGKESDGLDNRRNAEVALFISKGG